MNSAAFLVIFALGGLVCQVCGLECYACDNQEGNKDKCVKTTKQCEENENICLTSVGWKLPPYWTPYGERMHFVSKGCSIATRCEQEKSAMMPNCKRDWYDDWSCVECCSGDLCNYYVTLGGQSLRGSLWIFLAALTLALMGIGRV